MLKKNLLILAAFVLGGILHAQEAEDYIKKIDLKLRKDKTYLNVFYITAASDEKLSAVLSNVPRTDGREAFNAKAGANVEYMITFLKEGFATDSLLLLYVNEIAGDTSSSSGFFGSAGENGADTSMVINFRDMYALKTTGSGVYAGLYAYAANFLRQNENAEIPTLLRIQPDAQIKTSLGLSARDNEDYLNYARINSVHYYPDDKTAAPSARGRRQLEESAPMKIDASFSTISFSHEKMNFTLEGASLELSAAERVLNVLPWQNMALTAGFRTLFNMNGAKNPSGASYLDATFGARFRMNTGSIASNGTFIISDRPLLNFTEALIGDFHFTRPLTLPFINLYFALGRKSFDNPFLTVEKDGLKTAYYSTSQAEGSMSFYWNTSDKKTNRFRMDIGLGYYDSWKASYDSAGSYRSSRLERQLVNPVLAIQYNFVPDKNPLLGAGLRYFDSRPTLTFWLKILELSPKNTMRFETIYLGNPVARSRYDWESDGGIMFQLRYRYGI